MVFEYQTEDGAMSDVYNCRDEEAAKEKFDELRDSLMHAIDPAGCEVIDEATHYSVINREAGIFGYVRILDVDFDGAEQEGELMVHRKVANDVIDIFYKLYVKKYPLASVKLVDDFGQPGDDGNSMRANNTSAFCYRQVTGTSHLSWHSFGAAIDINPLQNPYMNKGRVSPEEAREYLDRKDKRPHMIDHSDYCYKVFIAHGWKWGGDWNGDKDYQHFYKELSGVKR